MATFTTGVSGPVDGQSPHETDLRNCHYRLSFLIEVPLRGPPPITYSRRRTRVRHFHKQMDGPMVAMRQILKRKNVYLTAAYVTIIIGALGILYPSSEAQVNIGSVNAENGVAAGVVEGPLNYRNERNTHLNDTRQNGSYNQQSESGDNVIFKPNMGDNGIATGTVEGPLTIHQNN